MESHAQCTALVTVTVAPMCTIPCTACRCRSLWCGSRPIDALIITPLHRLIALLFTSHFLPLIDPLLTPYCPLFFPRFIPQSLPILHPFLLLLPPYCPPSPPIVSHRPLSARSTPPTAAPDATRRSVAASLWPMMRTQIFLGNTYFKPISRYFTVEFLFVTMSLPIHVSLTQWTVSPHP